MKRRSGGDRREEESLSVERQRQWDACAWQREGDGKVRARSALHPALIVYLCPANWTFPHAGGGGGGGGVVVGGHEKTPPPPTAWNLTWPFTVFRVKWTCHGVLGQKWAVCPEWQKPLHMISETHVAQRHRNKPGFNAEDRFSTYYFEICNVLLKILYLHF